MNLTPHLDQLLSAARSRSRWGYARRAMSIAAFAVAGIVAVVVGLGRLDLGLCAVLIIPAAGLAGAFLAGASDTVIAQTLDERLHTHDLLCTAVSCRSKQDDASRLVLQQAEAYAASVGLSAIPARHVQRIEVAAVLVLLLSLTLSVFLGPLQQFAWHDSASSKPVSQTPGEDAHSRSSDLERPTDGKSRSPGELVAQEPNEAPAIGIGTGQGSKRPGADAGGKGQAQTASRLANELPEIKPVSVPDAHGTADGVEGGREAGLATTSGERRTAQATRAPLALSAAPLPPISASSRSELDRGVERLDPDSLDLIRAYFDLDAPQ